MRIAKSSSNLKSFTRYTKPGGRYGRNCLAIRCHHNAPGVLFHVVDPRVELFATPFDSNDHDSGAREDNQRRLGPLSFVRDLGSLFDREFLCLEVREQNSTAIVCNLEEAVLDHARPEKLVRFACLIWLEQFHYFSTWLDDNDVVSILVVQDLILLGEDFSSESRDAHGSHMLNSRLQLHERGGLLEAGRVQFGIERQQQVVMGEGENFALVGRFPRS